MYIGCSLVNAYLNWIWKVLTMRVGVVCANLDQRFVLDDVGGKMASVDASRIDTNRSFTFKHPRAWSVPVNNEGTAAPRVCPRGGVWRVSALGSSAFIVDNLDISDYLAALHLPWCIW